MSNCPTCKESILSQTPSLIGQTQCTTDCPEDITCVDIIPSNCVFYSGATLSCPSGNTSVNYGDTVTVALGKMYDLICQNSTSNTVQITANDTCYGYLASKITSSSLDITIANPGACEKLNIEEKCRTWTKMGAGVLNTSKKWKSYSDTSNFGASNYQALEYSNIKECVVKLRGTAINGSYTFQTTLIATLPFAPSKIRRYSVNYLIVNGTTIMPGVIEINNLGQVYFYSNALAPGNYLVPLDGIEFECACEPNC